MTSRWSATDDDYLAVSYATVPMTEMCEHLGRTPAALHQRAMAHGLQRPHGHDWPASAITYLREHYSSTPTCEIIAHLQRSYESVRMQAQRQGLTKVRRGMRYHVNHHAFDDLDPATAYVAGMILADGCVHDGAFHILNTDLPILEAIRHALGANHPIGTRPIPPYKTQHTLYISSRTMVDRLIALGITPRKSLTARLPSIPEALFWHFVRGYFDGDGCVVCSRGSLVMTFVSGSPLLMEQLSAAIATRTPFPARPITQHHNKHGWLLRYHGPSALYIADAMYRDAHDLYMARKRAVVERYRRERKQIRRTSWGASLV